jgi:hypothetical protein
MNNNYREDYREVYKLPPLSKQRKRRIAAAKKREGRYSGKEMPMVAHEAANIGMPPRSSAPADRVTPQVK